MIAEGTWPAVVVPVDTESGQKLVVQFGKSKEKQTPQAVVCFEIIAGPYSGERISWFGYFPEGGDDKAVKTVDRTIESLRLCGFKGDDMDKFNDQAPDIEVHIVVKHEEYQGKVQAKAQWINSPNRGVMTSNPMDQKELRMFGARFKSKLRALPPVDGKKAERQPRSVALPTAATSSGWSGNDAPDPPAANEYNQAPPPDDDSGIPF